jgi:predicted aconitase
MQSKPSEDELKSLGAALAASGAVALYHVEGVTPDAIKLNYERPGETFSIGKEDIREVYENTAMIGDEIKETDIVTVGCPHCSPDEMQKIASMLDGKTIQKEMWVCTSREVAERYPKLVNTIEKSGAKVVCDTCMVVSPASNNFQCMMVNSGKALAYVPSMCRVSAKYGSIEQCIKEAGVLDEN